MRGPGAVHSSGNQGCADRRPSVRPIAGPPGRLLSRTGSPYLGQTILGEPLRQSNVLFRTGDRRDETSIRRGHACAPRPSLFSDSGSLAQDLVEAFLDVRNETERRAAPLTPEDQLIQSMPDASPAKWHRAHTTWFFEQFLLGEHCEGYQPFHPDYAFLFNSYYVSAGPRHARHQRGHLTRPGADEVTAYRRHVDAAVVKFFPKPRRTRWQRSRRWWKSASITSSSIRN